MSAMILLFNRVKRSVLLLLNLLLDDDSNRLVDDDGNRLIDG